MMRGVALKAIGILALSVIVLSGCIYVDYDSIRVYCDRVEFRYSFDDDDVYTYKVEIKRLSDDAVVSPTRSITGNAPGRVSIPLYEEQPEGTKLYVSVDSYSLSEYAAP